MKFGLFYELSVPRPWTRESDRAVYDNALDRRHQHACRAATAVRWTGH